MLLCWCQLNVFLPSDPKVMVRWLNWCSLSVFLSSVILDCFAVISLFFLSKVGLFLPIGFL